MIRHRGSVAKALSEVRLMLTAHVGVFDFSPVRCSLSAHRSPDEKPMPKVKPPFLDFVREVVKGEVDEVSRRLATSPSLATVSSDVGAVRGGASTFFFSQIAHYFYAGDTALHMAAAAFRRPIAERLVAHGLPREESPRGRTPSLRCGRQPLGPDGTGRDDRAPRVGRRGSQRPG